MAIQSLCASVRFVPILSGEEPAMDAYGIAPWSGWRSGMTENEIGTIVVDEAITIHKQLGPGLLESVYEVILMHRLKKRGLDVERQVSIPVQFDGIKFDEGFKADLIINGRVFLSRRHEGAEENADE